MGDVYTAGSKYKVLLNREYYFILGKSKNEIHIRLKFSEIEFYHICGLHKLKDIAEINNPNKKQLFNDIISKKISSDLFKKSSYYIDVEERIELIENLEDFLDSNNTIFKYNKLTNTFSLIEADYLLKNSDADKNIYLFISRENKQSDTYFCRSAFSRDKSQRDYADGQKRYTLLYKEKIDLTTNEKQVLYTHSSYKNQYP